MRHDAPRSRTLPKCYTADTPSTPGGTLAAGNDSNEIVRPGRLAFRAPVGKLPALRLILNVTEEPAVAPLDTLAPGSVADVVSLEGDPSLTARLGELGLCRGAQVELLRNGSPMVLRLDLSRLSVRSSRLRILVNNVESAKSADSRRWWWPFGHSRA